MCPRGCGEATADLLFDLREFVWSYIVYGLCCSREHSPAYFMANDTSDIDLPVAFRKKGGNVLYVIKTIPYPLTQSPNGR